MLRGSLELGLLVLRGVGEDASAAALAVVDEDVDAATVTPVLGVVGALVVLVVVGEVGVFGYNVPGVDEAGEIAQYEEKDVDDRVC